VSIASVSQAIAAPRAALELHAGHRLSDTEWESIAARLLAFAMIVRGWEMGKHPGREVGNVEALCQRKP
jgi:hypothetical protein